MKAILILTMALLMTANVAMADHIGIYSDATGSSCNLQVGFSSSTAIIHKFTLGSTGSRFRLDLASAPGSAFFAFNSIYTTIGTLTSDLAVAYGTCIPGSIVVGTIVALWQPGAVSIVPSEGFLNIIVLDCNFGEYSATGGHASISGDGHGCDYDATVPATWGKVKALYR